MEALSIVLIKKALIKCGQDLTVEAGATVSLSSRPALRDLRTNLVRTFLRFLGDSKIFLGCRLAEEVEVERPRFSSEIRHFCLLSDKPIPRLVPHFSKRWKVEIEPTEKRLRDDALAKGGGRFNFLIRCRLCHRIPDNDVQPASVSPPDTVSNDEGGLTYSQLTWQRVGRGPASNPDAKSELQV